MCKTDNLQSNMQVFRNMSIANIVLGVALLIAGIVAVTYNLPNYCSGRRSTEGSEFSKAVQSIRSSFHEFDFHESRRFSDGKEDSDSSTNLRQDDWNNYDNCESDRKAVNDVMSAISLWGTLPAVVPIIFGAVGIFSAMKSSKCGVGVVLGFSIVGFLLSGIGCLLPLLGASVVTSLCDDYGQIRDTSEGRDWCDRYGGSLWAVVVLNIILSIYQLVFSIMGCCFCCAPEEVWNQGADGPAGAAMGAVPGYPAEAQHGYNQEAEGIPTAQAVPQPKV